MDFVLGILTGVALCLAYGHYLNNQRKKEEKEATSQMAKIYLALTKSYADSLLQEKLDAALEREDYAEAARLRDLIQKKQ